MSPLISVIIPTFNRSDLLKRALKSVLNQSYKNYEIIIVDNNSTDKTRNLLDKYKISNLKVEIVNNHGVIALSRNVGLKSSNGKFVAFLDSDDWWEKDKLKKPVEVFNSRPEIDLIYHNCFLTSKKNKKISNCRILKDDSYKDLLVNGNTIITSSVVVKKEILKKINFFSEDKNKIGWEDYDLWLRIAKLGCNFYLIHNKLGHYWVGEDNFDNPNRILINTRSIEELIIKPYLKDNHRDHIWWLDYTRAIANYKIKKKMESFTYFKKVIFLKSPTIYKIKSLFYILFRLPLI